MLDRRNFLFGAAAALGRPLQWSNEKNVSWTTELHGGGQSSPATFRNRIFATSSTGTDLFAEVLDAATGSQLWLRKVPASSPALSLAAPGPLAESDRYYALFTSGDLTGFDQTGNTLWGRRLSETFGAIDSAASLARTREAVIAYFSARGRNFLIAVDPQSGKIDWRVERPIPGASGTPVVTTAWNREVIVVANRGSIEGYSTVDGQLLWQREDMPRDAVIAPAGDAIVVGSAVAHGCAMLRLLPPGREPELVWKAEHATSAGAPPLVHDGFAYFSSPGGVLFCLDAASGKQVWTAPLKLSPSVALRGEGSLVYCFLQDGTTFVYESGRTPRKLAENALPAAAPLHAASLVPDGLLVRSANRLFHLATAPVAKPKPLWTPPKS